MARNNPLNGLVAFNREDLIERCQRRIATLQAEELLEEAAELTRIMAPQRFRRFWQWRKTSLTADEAMAHWKWRGRGLYDYSINYRFFVWRWEDRREPFNTLEAAAQNAVEGDQVLVNVDLARWLS
jgi:hypothetical protein